MRKLLLIIPMLFLASCHEQEMFEKQSTLQEDFKITASMEDFSNSRTVFEGEAGDENRRVLWQQNDALSVFMGSADENSKFTLASGDGTAFASFQGNVHIWGGVEGEDVAGFANVAYYPYTENVSVTYDADNESYALSTTFPAKQLYASNASFAQNVSPMVAVTKNKGSYAFMFKNVASWVNLYVKGSAKITKVVMKATNDNIAGDYILTAKNGIDPVAAINENGTSVKEIIMDCGENGIQLSKDEATIFTFTTIPFEFDANEVSFDIYGEGVYMKNAYIIKKAGSFLRSKFHGISKNSPVEFLPNSVVEGEAVQAILKGKGYPTLPDAIAAAEENDVITILEGQFDLASQLNTTSGQPNKTVTIKGAGIDKTILTSPKTTNSLPGTYANNLHLKFENITYNSPGGYSSGFGAAKSVEFVNCKIVGEYYAQSWAPHTFTNCNIDPQNGYLYTWASNCDFKNCVFNASEGKALQVYHDGSNCEYTVNIENCKFIAAKQATTYDGKPVTGIDINTHTTTCKFTVNIIGCSTEGFPTGLNSNTDLWNVKNTAGDIIVNVDGVEAYPNYGYRMTSENVYDVWSAKGLLHFSETQQKGVTLNIIDDIDFENAEFKAIPAGYNATLTVNGNNHAIKNVKVVSGNDDNTTGQASMFYAYTGSTLTIENLKFENIEVDAEINGSGYAAVVVGYAEGKVVLNNVDVNNANVYGQKSCGVLVGYGTGTSTVELKDCDVVESEVEATEDRTGAYAGRIQGSAKITNCSVDDEFKSTAPDGYANKYIGQRYKGCSSLTIDGIEYVDTYCGLQDVINQVAKDGTAILGIQNGVYTHKYTEIVNKNITLQPGIGASKEEITLDGQIFFNGSSVCTVKDLTLTNENASDHPSTSVLNGSTLTAWGSVEVTVEKCTFNQVAEKTSASAVKDWWATGNLTWNLKDCVFNCNGQRPLQLHETATITGCTFNEPYRYALQVNSATERTMTMKDCKIVKKSDNGKPAYFIQLTKGGSEGTTMTANKKFIVDNNTFDVANGIVTEHYVAEKNCWDSSTVTITGGSFVEID